MSQLIKFKRGAKASLPASAEVGEPLFATDTNELYIGTGTGVALVTGEDRHVKVGAEGTADYLNTNYFEQDAENNIRIKQNTLLSGVDADKVDGKNVDDNEVSTSYLWTAGKVISYVASFAQGLDWQNSVLSKVSAPPVGGESYTVLSTDGMVANDMGGRLQAGIDGTNLGLEVGDVVRLSYGSDSSVHTITSVYAYENSRQYSISPTPTWDSVTGGATVEKVTAGSGAVAGDRFLIGASATGDFAGKEDQIAEFDGAAYIFTVPNPGFAVYVEDETKQYTYNGTQWVNFGSTTNHNATSGLQGGTTDEYYHLTNDEHTALTSGTDITLHSHNSDNVNEGTVNLFFTDLRAQDAVGNILLDTNSIDLTYAEGNISADLRIQNPNPEISLTIDGDGLAAKLNLNSTQSIGLSVDPTYGLTADLAKDNTNTVNLSIGANGLTADVNVQASESIDLLTSEVGGLKANLIKADTSSVALTVNEFGLSAEVLVDQTPSVTLTVSETGVIADVNVDDSTIKIDATSNYIYVDLVDGGSF